MIFEKIYFPQLSNAWVLRKIISENDFQSIQTQPKYRSSGGWHYTIFLWLTHFAGIRSLQVNYMQPIHM